MGCSRPRTGRHRVGQAALRALDRDRPAHEAVHVRYGDGGSRPAVTLERKLRNENAAVIEAVAGGQSFVVTRNGEPVAELRPVKASRRRTFISRDDIAALASADVRVDHRQFRADLDRLIDQEV